MEGERVMMGESAISDVSPHPLIHTRERRVGRGAAVHLCHISLLGLLCVEQFESRQQSRATVSRVCVCAKNSSEVLICKRYVHLSTGFSFVLSFIARHQEVITSELALARLHSPPHSALQSRSSPPLPL